MTKVCQFLLMAMPSQMPPTSFQLAISLLHRES
jgi:hypothetical protein